MPPACSLVMISSFDEMNVGWKSISLSARNVPARIGVS
jgi:hypothetical protein